MVFSPLVGLGYKSSKVYWNQAYIKGDFCENLASQDSNTDS